MKKTGLLLIGFTALLMLAETARVKAAGGGFGGFDENHRIQDVSSKSKDENSLVLGFLIPKNFFSSGVGMSGKSAPGVEGVFNGWAPHPKREELEIPSLAELRPIPLPGRSVPFLHYLLGFSLCLILLAIGGAIFIVSKRPDPAKDFDDGDEDNDASETQEKFREQTLGLFRRLMVMMMVVDNHIHPAELETIKEIYQKLTGRKFPEAELPGPGEISFDETVEEVISQYKDNLNQAEKEIILLSIFLVGAADNEIREEELDLLRNIADLFGFSTGSMNEVHKVALEDQED